MPKKLKKISTPVKIAALLALPAGFFSTPAAACGSGTPIIGTMCLFAGDFDLRYHLIADGRLLPIAQYNNLFSVIGTKFGGDGVKTFAIPDFRGRVVIGASPTHVLGKQGGAETVTLTESQLPAHSHQADVTTNGTLAIANTNFATGAIWARDERDNNYFKGELPSSVPMSNQAVTATINNTGGGQPVSIMQPYTTMNWLIVYQGTYPQRAE